MNILFIGPYRQNDGWGLAAKYYLRSLAKLSQYTTSAAPIYMSQNIDHNIDNDLIEMENVSCDNFDVVIQKTLPSYFEKHAKYTIGIYTSETKNLNYSLYLNKLNLLDELWVMSESEKEVLQKSGVNIPIVVIPGPVNTEELDQHLDCQPLEIPQTENKFVFYMIGEYNERKNIPAAVVAFNREFANDNNVCLIIKTGINGISEQENQKVILDDINKLKAKLRLFNHPRLYQNEIVITGRITFEQLMSLHKTGDCLLVPSRGEAYCRPALEALYFGNSVICTKGIHTCSILKDKCITVDSTETPIVIDHPPAPHLYTGWETWDEISILDLQSKMRAVYNSRPQFRPDLRGWIKDNFSYDVIAKKIESRLCQLSQT